MKLATPQGFRDILSNEAQERERITRQVQDMFASHGFAPIETPTLEVMDIVQSGRRALASPFKFFDSRGDLLAMRPDVTLQVARMCATRFPDSGNSLKLRYTQRVFRETDEEAQAKPREITQIGVECIGVCPSVADAELVGLLASALRIAGVNTLTMAVATVAPLRALLDRSGAKEGWRQAVLDAYHNSDFVELDRLTSLCEGADEDAEGIAPAYAQAIKDLSRIRGGREAIDEAYSITSPLGCSDGLDALKEIYASLEKSLDAEILIDFSLVSSFDYYTGIVFEAFSPYLGASLGSGGRYDNMLGAFGKDMPAAGFAFCLEQAMAAETAESMVQSGQGAPEDAGKLRIAVPKGALNTDTVQVLKDAGLDVTGLDSPGRQLVISTPDADYIIVRPSDAPAFVSYGAADCGICGRDSLLESKAQVVQLADLGFGGCRFVVAEPKGSAGKIEERYRRLGSIRVATKYPNITSAYYAKTGIQVDIVKLHGNIELAPLTGMAERIVDITATGTTLAENNLEVVDDVLESTARFFANPCALRTNGGVVELARRLEDVTRGKVYEPIAGKPQ